MSVAGVCFSVFFGGDSGVCSLSTAKANDGGGAAVKADLEGVTSVFVSSFVVMRTLASRGV